MTAMPHWPLYLGLNRDLTNSLEKVLFILDKLKNPQNQLSNVIHITGTNGKGSTANYIYNILRAHGYSVNLYTSPHIYECNERIVVNGRKISDDELFFFLEKLRVLCEYLDIEPTIFEATTIVCCMYFLENNSDFNIFEVGMGGRNDATNIFKKSLSIFTPIYVDHINFLGSTPFTNAFEKVGIIKTDNNVISGPQVSEVRDLIKSIAQKKVYFFDEDYSVEKLEDVCKFLFTYKDKSMIFDLPKLAGDHQLINLSVSLMSVIASDIKINENFINVGILNTYWPVRMEAVLNQSLLSILPYNSHIFIDGAHNVSGAFVVAKFLLDKKNTHRLFIINGRTKNTDSCGFLKQFVGVVDGIVAVRVNLEALSESPEKIVADGLKLGLNIKKGDSIVDALNIISFESGCDPVCVVICGSLYLARDLKSVV